MGLSLVAPLLFLAFALGALVGSRGRSVRAALCTAIANRRITGGAPHAAGEDAAEGAVDADLVATASAEPASIDISDFLRTEVEPELDEHPELVVSPVMLYKVFLERQLERSRAAKAARRNTLIGLGLTAEQAAEQVAEEDALGEMAHVRAKSSLKVLEEAGARLMPIQTEGTVKEALVKEQRRKQRNVALFLSKSHSVRSRRRPYICIYATYA